jgi:hypothetical protein
VIHSEVSITVARLATVVRLVDVENVIGSFSVGVEIECR